MSFINPISPIIPVKPGTLVPRKSRADVASAQPGLTLPAVIVSQQALTTIILQQGMSVTVQVTWARTVTTTTDWESSDDQIATIVANTTDTTLATLTANEEDSGVAEITATAEVNGKDITSTIEVCIVAGGIPQGSIALED